MNRQHHAARWVIVWLGLLPAATLCVYHNTYRVPFLLDDVPTIVENTTLTQLWPHKVPVGLERRPVGRLSFALNDVLHGRNRGGYHALNVAIHLAAGLILFDLVRRTLLLDPLRSQYARSASAVAFGVALIWLVHPLQTQSVTYVIQRLESLMGLFYLACLYSVLRGSQSPRPGWWYAAAVAAFWLGIGTKEVMATGVLVVPLFDRIFLAGSWSDVLRRRWPVYAGFLPAAAALGMAMSPSIASEENFGAGFGFKGITPLEYLGTQPGVILYYLRLAFWPDPLCLDYEWRVAHSPTEILLPGAAVVALVVASLVLLWYRPRIGFLGVSFFLILAPTSSIMPIRDMAVEHRMYLPLAAVVLLTVTSAHQAWTRWTGTKSNVFLRRAVPWTTLGVIAALLGYLTIARNADYRSAESIWFDTVQKRPENARARYNLANELASNGQPDIAAEHYRKAVEIRPNYTLAHFNLGFLLRAQGEYAEAVHHYRRALVQEPDAPEIRNQLGVALEGLGKPSEAVEEYRLLLQRRPDYHAVHVNLGNALLTLGQLDEAIEHYRTSLKYFAHLGVAHNGLGAALASQGKLEEAIEHFHRAVNLDPKDARAKANLEQARRALDAREPVP